MAYGYGLFRGLNEAYDAYRERESQIVADEMREAESAYQQELREREREQYEYGLSRRPQQEEMERLNMENARRQAKIAEMEFEDKWSDEARAQRRTMAANEAEKIRLDLERSGIQLDQAKLDQDQQELQRMYEGWARDWEKGMSLDELIRRFNDEDEIEGNDIASANATPEGGFRVEYKNGMVEEYRDRNDVLQTLYEMSDPSFAKQVLLSEAKGRADLSAAMAKNRDDSIKDFNARGQKFSDDVRSEVQAAYGKIFPNGLVDFGADGDEKLAAEIRAMAMSVGRVYGYDMTKTSAAELVSAIGREAEKVMDTRNETREQRAKERYELLGLQDVQEILGDRTITEIPEEGDDMYAPLMRHLRYEQAIGDVRALEDAVYRKFILLDQQGKPIPRQSIKTGTDIKEGEGDIPGEADLMSDAPSAEEIASMQMTDDPESGYGLEDRSSISLGEGFAAVMQGLLSGNVGKSKQLAKMQDELKRGLPRKKKRQLEQAARQSYTEYFADLTGEQKAGWLNTYGKYLTRREYNEAKKKVPKQYRDTVIAYAQ